MSLSRRQFLTTGATVAAAATTPLFARSEDRARYANSVLADQDLLAYWRMEGDLDDAKGRAPGMVQGGVPRFVQRSGGQAVTLAQGQFLTMGPTPQLDVPISTIELFFQLTATPPKSHNPCIIAKRSTRDDCRFSLHVHRDLSHFVLWNGQYPVRVELLDGPLKIGRWYHLAVTHLRYRVQAYNEFYLDGVRCEKSAISAINQRAVRLPLQIGASTPGGNEPCTMAADEVAVYGRYFTAEDAARHADLAGLADRRKCLLAVATARAAKRHTEHMQRVARLLADPVLTERGEPHVYRREHLKAVRMPVGGIGTGSIEVDGQARLRVWHVFNNHAQAELPHSFFAVRAQTPGRPPVVRALQTEPIGSFHACTDLAFRGEYPFGRFNFHDEALPIRVRMEAFSPHVPLDADRSSVPCAVFCLTAANPGDRPVEVAFLGAHQNAVGFGGKGTVEGRTHPAYGGNVNRVVRWPRTTVLHMTSNRDRNGAAYGDMTLAVFDPRAAASAAWEDLDRLHQDLVGDSHPSNVETAGPSPAGETLDGALTTRFTLPPGASHTVRFVITWHFPNATHGAGAWQFKGNRYATRFESALDVARYLEKDLDELQRVTRLYHDTFYRSNLPRWLLDRIGSQSAVLASPTCFWSADGYFGGYEGCREGSGCCPGNCAHVWHYAQSHARLFPEIARRMRESSYQYQTPDGNIPFRHSRPSSIAFDGQCGEILGSYREHLCSVSGDWLDAHWPNIKRAMDFVISHWDADEDGVPAGQQHNTLDAALGGSSSWLGTLYLAALEAAARMAQRQRDTTSVARYRKIFARGAKTQDRTLFNGEYYVQRYDGSEGENYLSGCHMDQLLGQWWATQLDLGWLYPADHVKSALQAIFQYNFRTSFRGVDTSPTTVPRRFVVDGDYGTLITTWPAGGRPEPPSALRFANEVWTGFEYSTAAAMIQVELVPEALAMVRAASQRYDGRLRTGVTDRAWGYSGNPFSDDECGKFYARAMSVWSLLLACQGFVYNGPAGQIGFRPKWRPHDHASFFTAAEGWGLFVQKQEPQRQTNKLEVVRGKLGVRRLVLELPDDVDVTSCKVRAAGKLLAVQASRDGRDLVLEFAESHNLQAPATLDVLTQWRGSAREKRGKR